MLKLKQINYELKEIGFEEDLQKDSIPNYSNKCRVLNILTQRNNYNIVLYNLDSNKKFNIRLRLKKFNIKKFNIKLRLGIFGLTEQTLKMGEIVYLNYFDPFLDIYDEKIEVYSISNENKNFNLFYKNNKQYVL